MPDVSRLSTTTEDGESPERNRLLLYGLGGLAFVSAVVAALVIISSGGSAAPAKDPVAIVRATDVGLTVGSPKAAVAVVVYEDFGSVASRTFEIASRDFLRGEAAQGRVSVKYRPVSLEHVDYSTRALTAWGGVLHDGKARQALAFHDLLFDRQPAASDPPQGLLALAKDAGVKDSAVLESVVTADQTWARSATTAATAAGVRTTPSVRVDGRPMTAPSPVALADQLQRSILKAGG